MLQNLGMRKFIGIVRIESPSKTNKANVVEMTEADAIAAGKRPSKKRIR